MSTVSKPRKSVQSDPIPLFFEDALTDLALEDGDREWAAAEFAATATYEPGEPLGLAEWIEGEAQSYRDLGPARGEGESDEIHHQRCMRDLYILLCCELEELALSTRFHDARTVEEYCDRRGCVSLADLDALTIPSVGDKRIALARAIDAQAAFYLSLDTQAGRLVAWKLLTLADDVQRFDSIDVPDYYNDVNAWHDDQRGIGTL